MSETIRFKRIVRVNIVKGLKREVDFFCEYVNDDLEPLIEDGYTFYSVDKRLFLNPFCTKK